MYSLKNVKRTFLLLRKKDINYTIITFKSLYYACSGALTCIWGQDLICHIKSKPLSFEEAELALEEDIIGS